MWRRVLPGVLMILLSVPALDGAPLRRRAIRSGSAIVATVLSQPQAVPVEGIPRLAWEVFLQNYRNEQITVTSVEIRDGARLLISYEGTFLESRMITIPFRPPASSLSPTVLLGRESALMFFLIPQEPSEVPSAITMVIRLSTSRGNETVHPPLVPVQGPPFAVAAPLRGQRWFAGNAVSDESPHMRAVSLLEGKMYISQRFAIDWLKVDAGGLTLNGPANQNSSYFAFGQDVLAVADGVVAATSDGMPDNVPRESPAVPITFENAAGNFIVINIGNGRFAHYWHLQNGSVRVSVGADVRKGQVIARVGDSGNAAEPHLHFQLCDAIPTFACNGLPYVLERFIESGVTKQNQLPGDTAVVDFP